MIGDVKSRLGAREVRETTKRHVRHRLQEQRKVSGSLLEGSVPLTKKSRRLLSFLKEKSGR